MNTGKMVKAAKVIDKVLRILRGFVLVGCIACAACMVLVPIFRESIIAVEYINLGNVSLTIADDSIVNWNALILSQEIEFFAGLIGCAFVWYAFTLLLRVIAPMKDGRPFEAGISNQIRKLALITLVGGAITETATVFASRTAMNAYDFAALLNSSVVSKYSYNGTFDPSFLAGAAILFLLSCVFRYGEELQRESDETL
jgi:hypothetical protein